MNRTTSIKFVAIILLVSSALSESCSKGCIRCEAGGKCTSCFRRPFRSEFQCGETGSSCYIYDRKYSSNRCTWCRADKGYAQYSVSGGSCTYRRDIPKNCVGALYHSSKTVCFICDKGFSPDRDGKCTKKHYLSGCKWSGVKNRNPYCFRCNSITSHINTSGRCVGSSSSSKGCLISNNRNTCSGACNGFEGYYMTTPGSCVHGSSEENVASRVQEGQMTRLTDLLKELSENALENLQV